MELKKPFQYSMLFLAMASSVTMAKAKHYKSEVPPAYFNGFYIGIGAGAGTFMTHTTDQTTVNSISPASIPVTSPPGTTVIGTQGGVLTNDSSDIVDQYGAMGDVFVGYGRVLSHNIYVGASLGANIFDANDTNISNDVQSQDVLTTALGTVNTNTQRFMSSETEVSRNTVEPFLDFKLGYLATPSVLTYVKGGINYNKINIKTTSDYLANGTLSPTHGNCTDPTLCYTKTTRDSIQYAGSKTGIGYRAGIGAEVMLTRNIGINADYVYTFYPSVDTNIVGQGNDIALSEGIVPPNTSSQPIYNKIPAKVTGSNKATVNDQQVLINLIFHLT